MKTKTFPRDDVSRKVRAFYEDCSFPGYEEFETPFDLIEKAQKGIFARQLDDQLPLGVKILDAGCGTGQLSIFLSLVGRQVLGVDMTFNSLRKATEFKNRFLLNNVSFAQMNLFSLALQEETFDFVFCTGVLHHTADAAAAFRNLTRLVKPGGFIVIGLYNTYGRLPLDLRRWVFRLTGDRLVRLDYVMRQRGVGEDKKRIWFRDQYRHPHERKFSVRAVLRWFEQNGIEYVNSAPPIRRGTPFSADRQLFEPQPAGSPLENLLCQLGWMFTTGKEGGLFITIGRKPA